jgi:SAM-dependent methyltransferase
MATEQYDAFYYAHDCGTPYERNEAWLGFFDQVAERIVRTIRPGSVLDAGCAFGFLVERLRARGVEAWGIDISEHAIARVDSSVADYCRVGSVLAPFERRYDLIVCMEVLEHLSQPDGVTAVANFAAHADDVLFSSTPHDFRELTHANVRPPDHWVGLFAEQGLYRDADFDASFITDWARRFRRPVGPLSRVLAAYERQLWRLEQEAIGRRDLAFQQRDDIIRLEVDVIDVRRRREQWEHEIATLRAELQALYSRIAQQEVQLRWRQDQVDALQDWHDNVVASPGWQLTQRLQAGRARLTPPGSRRERLLGGGLARAGLGAGGSDSGTETAAPDGDTAQP